MKKFKLSRIAILCFCVFAIQNVLAVDVPLKKDDPAPGGGSNICTQLKTIATLKTQSIIPVTADIVGSELIIDFTTTVGTAYVSVVDSNGNVVYQTVVDTFSSSEVVIPVNGMSSGNYSLKISYGSTHLTGDFQL